MLGNWWADLGYAGTFVAGLIIGGIAVARLLRIAIEYLRRQDKE